jgi:aminobenzoyl-glutamate utilization protein B
MMAYKNVLFTFIGKKGGGPWPWTGKNALDAAVHMYSLVNFEKEQVLPHSSWHSINEFMMTGGQCTVAIPHIAQLDYAFRSFTLEEQDKIYDMLKRCAQAAAMAIGCEVEERIVADQRTTNPNFAITRLGYRNLEIVGPPKFPEKAKKFARDIQKNLGIEPLEEPFIEEIIPPWEAPPRHPGAGDDCLEFSWHAPMFRLYVAGPMSLKGPEGYRYPTWVNSALCGTGAAHEMGFVVAKTLAISAVELLTTPSELEKAWEEFNNRTSEYKEEPLIPKGVKAPIDLRWPEWVNGKWLSR